MIRLSFAIVGLGIFWGAWAASPITVGYPPENARLGGVTNVYFIGAVPATNGFVTLNGATTAVYRTGAFLGMVGVGPGKNLITVEWGTNSLVRCVTAQRPEVPLPAAVHSSTSTVATVPFTTHDPYKDLGIPTNAVFAASPPYGKNPGDVFVMVDAGHGGDDSGAISPHGWAEKDVNLAQARAIRDQLRRKGFKVVMTRDDDTYPPLYSRPQSAWRLKVDAFISVHHNATAADRNPRLARHTVTYASNEKGLKLAEALQRRIAPVMAPVKDCGAKLKSLAVCRNPAVPSCLLEVDFINLPEGEEGSWDVNRQKRVAEAVAEGLVDWMTEGVQCSKSTAEK